LECPVLAPNGSHSFVSMPCLVTGLPWEGHDLEQVPLCKCRPWRSSCLSVCWPHSRSWAANPSWKADLDGSCPRLPPGLKSVTASLWFLGQPLLGWITLHSYLSSSWVILLICDMV
jgi:hypothetical protein